MSDVKSDIEEILDFPIDSVFAPVAAVRQILIEALRRIEKLENPWVSVDDRLPEVDGEYLVWTIGGEYLVRCSHALGERLDNTWKAHYTHWMPIPPSPKEDTA